MFIFMLIFFCLYSYVDILNYVVAIVVDKYWCVRPVLSRPSVIVILV
jgi:hypothetical protein